MTQPLLERIVEERLEHLRESEVVFDDNGKRVIELRDSSRTADAQRLLHAGQAELQLLLDRYMEFDQ
ncbi:MAG: hypothetical protein WBO28_05665 [Flavobacteriales bacterium]|nr:hypothetical protein [Flavobacteriales bacterium]